MKPGPQVLERNLEALLRRAYVPAVPRESFRRALVADFTERAARRAGVVVDAPPRGLLTFPRLVAAAAAVVLALVGARFWAGAESGDAAGAEALLAAGHVIERRAADGDWAVVARADERDLEPRGGYLEIATPDRRSARVLLEAGEVALEPGSTAAFTALGEDSGAELTRGGLRARLDEALRVRTSEGDLIAGAGAVRVGFEAPDPLPSAWDSVDGTAGSAVAWVHVECEAGRVELPGEAAPRVLTAGSEAYLRGARVFGLPEPVAALQAADPVGPRRAVGAGPAVGSGEPDDSGEASEPEASEPTGLHGVVLRLDEQGQPAPVHTFDVVLLEDIAVPRVAEPRIVQFETEDGAFEVPEIVPGQYTAFVRAPGHALWRSGKLVLGGGPVELNATLEVGRTARGFVIDAETRTPVPDAVVISETDAPVQILTIRGEEYPAGFLAQSITGSDGSFELAHLSSGNQVLRAWAPGWAPTWLGPLAGGSRELGPLAFELERGGTLTGVVEDDAGQPLEGSMLVTSLTDFTAMHPIMTYVEAQTDAAGRYRMEDLPEGSWALLEFGVIEDSSEAGAPELEFVHIVSGETLVVDFKRDPGAVRLSGVVTDASGAPASQRAIWLVNDQSAGPESMRSTTTAADGSYEFAVQPDLYALCISGDVPVEMLVLAQADLRDGVDGELDVTLPGGSISGTVSHAETGARLSGVVLVCLRSGVAGGTEDFVAQTSSKADGSFEFPHLFPGRYQVIAYSAVGLAEQASQVVEVGNDDTGVVDLELWPGGALQLLVLGPDGPVANARVRLRGPEGEWMRFSNLQHTNAQGRYVVGGMRAVSWTLSVEAPGFEPLSEVVSVPLGEPLQHTVRLTPR